MAWEENSGICLNMQLIAILSRIGVAFVLQILLGSHNKERFMLMYFEKFLECIVSTVKYIESLCAYGAST